MAIVGIGNNYNNVYESTYTSQKNEAAKKAETKEKTAVQSENSKSSTSTNNKVSDYNSYLSDKYDCVKNGSVAISGSYLRQCANDSEKAKELEKTLSLYNDIRDKGYANAKQNAQKIGARLVSYSESWSIDNTGNVTMMALATVTSDTKGWKELAEEQEEKLKEEKEKAEQEEKIKEQKEEKQEQLETLQAMKDIRSQYGDDVIVEFSGDGMAKLIEGRKGYLDRPLSEEEAARRAERQAAFDGTVVKMENTHRMVIPNVQTNDKLYNSLAGADAEVVKAANGIIKNYLMPGNVSGMSEDERKSMIAFGMEEAKYLAENYLDEKQAGEFLSAMETIAKYGMNGSVAEDGTVTYHIEKGLNSAGQVDDMDILKQKAPDLYREINELNQSIINHKGGEKYGAKFLELHKRAAGVLNATNEKGETNSEAAVKEYKKWEEETEKTELPDIFKDTKYTSMQTFFESLQNHSQLTNDWLNNSMARFMKWLNRN